MHVTCNKYHSEVKNHQIKSKCKKQHCIYLLYVPLEKYGRLELLAVFPIDAAIAQ